MILSDSESKNNRYISSAAKFYKNDSIVLQSIKERCLKGYCEELDGFTKEEYMAYRLALSDMVDTFQECYEIKNPTAESEDRS